MYSRFVYKRELNDELLLTLEEINQDGSLCTILARTMEEEWEFITHPEDIGYRVVVYETVSYDTIDQIIRQRYGLSQYTPLVISHRLPNWMLGPQGNRAPPMTISSTAVLSWLLHGRTWISELPMLITMGPKDIAEYEFHYRTNF
ncbi:uncharacterized protein LOC117125999 [Brassica rapa]|uniref:(rape) hypothetical protein n=1 Tax=Brassica napus TaxID=3708 RepID=A0A816SML8_BRANA|nr:uncharacterized protein LOC117125999 [Brassica rapa]CAF2086913.1 unnamed protein product [Brassica napus]